MREVLNILFIILLVPVLLIVFTIVHELGHTILARLLGDPNSTFYLVKVVADHTCFGYNIYDPTKLSWAANLLVSLGGLLATQLVALIALLLLRLPHKNRLSVHVLSIIAFGFTLLDIPVQVIQGLLYNLNHHIWPTNVDLMDFMLLLQEKTGTSQILLKGLLLAATAIYLVGFVWLYRKNKAVGEKIKLSVR
jgi:hypothetical protein